MAKLFSDKNFANAVGLPALSVFQDRIDFNKALRAHGGGALGHVAPIRRVLQAGPGEPVRAGLQRHRVHVTPAP